jgi:protein-S-isoprenylcysteine O-methyltransferase Ste14
MVWEVISVEEPELVKRLGAKYVQYKQNVPMFFPRVVKRRGTKPGG